MGVYPPSNYQQNTPEDRKSFFHALTDQITVFTSSAELHHKVIDNVLETYNDKEYRWPTTDIEQWKMRKSETGSTPDRLCIQTAR